MLASIGQIGHDGIVLGLLAMLIGQQAFPAASATNAIMVAAQFLMGDRLFDAVHGAHLWTVNFLCSRHGIGSCTGWLADSLGVQQ
jgi:hypothetical protein